MFNCIRPFSKCFFSSKKGVEVEDEPVTDGTPVIDGTPVSILNAISSTSIELYPGCSVLEAETVVRNQLNLPSNRSVRIIRGVGVLSDEEPVQQGDQFVVCSERPEITRLCTDKRLACIRTFIRAVSKKDRDQIRLMLGTVAEDAFANQAEIDNAKSEAIWASLKEQGVLDERGNINAQLTINRENIDTWLGGELEAVKDPEAVKDHVLVILQQALLGNHAIKINQNGDNVDVEFGEYYDGSQFLEILEERAADPEVLNNSRRACKDTDAYKVLVKELLAISIVGALMKHNPIEEGGVARKDFTNLINAIVGLPDYIVEAPENFLKIVDALMKHKFIANRAQSQNLIDAIRELPEYTVKSQENFLSIVDALMKHKYIANGFEFANLINFMGNLCEDTVKFPENFLSIVDALMEHQPIATIIANGFEFTELIDIIGRLPKGIVKDPKKFLKKVNDLVEQLVEQGPIPEYEARNFMFIRLLIKKAAEETAKTLP